MVSFTPKTQTRVAQWNLKKWRQTILQKHWSIVQSPNTCIWIKGLRDKQIYKDTLNTLSEPFVYDPEKLDLKLQKSKFSIDDEGLIESPVSISLYLSISPANIDAVHDMIFADCRIGLKQISNALNIVYEHPHHIVPVDLDMKGISAKWIPNVRISKCASEEISVSICAWSKWYRVLKPCCY